MTTTSYDRRPGRSWRPRCASVACAASSPSGHEVTLPGLRTIVARRCAPATSRRPHHQAWPQGQSASLAQAAAPRGWHVPTDRRPAAAAPGRLAPASAHVERVRPPSTRSRVSGAPRSVATSRASSVTWAAMPSRTARTRCPRFDAKVIPLNDAVASGAHHGAASPARAGTQSTPLLLEGARLLSSSDGARHEPSSDHPPDGRRRGVDLSVRRRTGSRHAVARRPTSSVRQLDRTGSWPSCASRNAPVP